jgi:hypothetical protein
MFLTENRQTKKHLSTIILAGLLLPFYSCGQENKPVKPKTETDSADYFQVNYAKASNIVKEPEKLTGDEKAIFYHPYFLKLTSKQTKNLKPLKIKKEFAKLGITLKENDRFVDAYIFFRTYYIGHKVSCEQWESFKDLAPE